MSTTKLAHLKDRGIIRVSGSDARKLLDGLVTNNLDHLHNQTAIYTGLLSPQGKILFDFFVACDDDDLLIDVAGDQVAELIKRLTFYRLRADVGFDDASDTLAVVASWGETAATPGGTIAYTDPRLADLGQRIILPAARLTELAGELQPAEAYHQHRIALGVPEAGRDFVLGDAFPHEALYDQLHGVDFKKGCFIGQEVVSRMQHRGTARKRIVPVCGSGVLQGEADVTAGDAKIGRVTSADGARGLALLRLDRASAAVRNGVALNAGGVEIHIEQPDWIAFDIATGQTPEHN